MTLEGVQNYFIATLPVELNARNQLRLLRLVFGLVFACAVAVHLLVRTGSGLLDTILHAATIGLVYAVSVGLVSLLLPFLRHHAPGLQVWQIWIVSAVGLVIGFYFVPFVDLVGWLIGRDVALHDEPLGFLQLLPVWVLVTYLFVQPYMNDALRLELDRLREVNSLLARRDTVPLRSSSTSVLFESGRTSFRLDARNVRNVHVDDHYCYVHYRRDGGFAKRDLAMPLRDVLAILPEYFIRVHRSHVVNVGHVTSVRRKGRNIRLVLTDGFEVPVSRHRLDEVLPHLETPT